MKQRRRVNQMQAMLLFDELCQTDAPNLIEMPADRSLELETAVAELLLKAVGKVERERGGDRDA
jgi:hypothetical protein